MAVAEKPVRTATTRSPEQQRLLGSLAGAVYVLFTLGMVFSGLPVLWGNLAEALNLNPFLSTSLLLAVDLAMWVGLVLLGLKLEKPTAVPGSRAGAFIGAAMLLVVLLVGLSLMGHMATRELGVPIEMGTAGLVVAILLVGVVWILARPGFGRWLVRIEEQGWFHGTSFKANQGVRVRRCTLIAFLVIAIFGIYTGIQHNLFGSSLREGGNNWEFQLPYGQSYYLFLMFHLEYTLPVVLVGLAIWFSWRLVNWPTFADFLIATEAEINKVSWTTRKRLVQDTIVVLVTVVLLTAFLFFVDLLWIRVLGNPYVRVLQINLQDARTKQNVAKEW